jgi:hypothetical protein
MNTSMYSRLSRTVSTTKKSHAMITWAWVARTAARLVGACGVSPSRAGGIGGVRQVVELTDWSVIGGQ